MKTVYIVDAIGIHCGMHYYGDSFRTLLRENGIDSKILSNYSDSDFSPFFRNIYEGNLLSKLYKLAISCLKLLFKVIIDKKSVYLVFSYGTPIDFILLIITMISRRCIIDVHEVIMQGSENNKTLRRMFSYIYKRTKHVIIHSKRSEDILKDIGFKGQIISVPHFEYQTRDKYDISRVSIDVQRLINDKLNLLWFGNITYSKGIDLYIDCINALPKEIKGKINVIIAGRSLDGVFEKCNVSNSVFSIKIKRLNDDEMSYLYSRSDYVVLPYRQTSQSGVLEMAFHYKKPVLVSNIPYFSMMLSKYPSFGKVISFEEGFFEKILESLTNDSYKYYSEEDVYKYTHREENIKFVNDFKQIISII